MSYICLPAVFGWQANVFKVLMHSDLGWTLHCGNDFQ